MRRPLLAAAVGLAAACGRADEPKAAPPAAQGAGGGPADSGGSPACPRTGHWNECGVILRLNNAGMVPIPTDEMDGLPSLGPKPFIYTLGGRHLAVFIFPDLAARKHAMASLDTLKFVPATKELTIRGETTVIDTDNLLGFFDSKSEQQRERVSDALQVGPPQP